ncbi:MAG: TetR/AcrR family transcriptional regulator [Candidatus Binatus sp.]
MTQAPQIDGRFARSIRTRRAVVEALLDLILDGDLRPTAIRIAEHAGISPRLVFHHFEDLEAIYSELARTQAERVKPLIGPVPTSLPLPQRIEVFTAQRGRVLETLSPVRRAAVLLEPFRPELARQLDLSRKLMSAATLAAFEPELSQLPDTERRTTAAALDLVASWTAWEQMRRHQHLPQIQAREVMAATIGALLTNRPLPVSPRHSWRGVRGEVPN